MPKHIPFTHACEVCGQPNAAWGRKVRLRRGEPGEWFCYSHYPHKEKFTIVVRPRGEPILPQRKPVQQSLF